MKVVYIWTVRIWVLFILCIFSSSTKAIIEQDIKDVDTAKNDYYLLLKACYLIADNNNYDCRNDSNVVAARNDLIQKSDRLAANAEAMIAFDGDFLSDTTLKLIGVYDSCKDNEDISEETRKECDVYLDTLVQELSTYRTAQALTMVRIIMNEFYFEVFGNWWGKYYYETLGYGNSVYYPSLYDVQMAIHKMPEVLQVDVEKTPHIGEDVKIYATLKSGTIREIKQGKEPCEEGWRYCDGKIVDKAESEDSNNDSIKQDGMSAVWLLYYVEGVKTLFAELDIRVELMEFNEETQRWEATIPWYEMMGDDVTAGRKLVFAIGGIDKHGFVVSEDLFPNIRDDSPNPEPVPPVSQWDLNWGQASLPSTRGKCPFIFGYKACMDVNSKKDDVESDEEILNKMKEGNGPDCTPDKAQIDLYGMSAKVVSNSLNVKLFPSSFSLKNWSHSACTKHSRSYDILIKRNDDPDPDDLYFPDTYIVHIAPDLHEQDGGNLVGLCKYEKSLVSGDCLTKPGSKYIAYAGEECIEEYTCDTSDCREACRDSYCEEITQPDGSATEYCSPQSIYNHCIEQCDINGGMCSRYICEDNEYNCIHENQSFVNCTGTALTGRVYVAERSWNGRNYLYVDIPASVPVGNEIKTIYTNDRPVTLWAFSRLTNLANNESMSDFIGAMNYYRRAHSAVFLPGIPPAPRIFRAYCNPEDAGNKVKSFWVSDVDCKDYIKPAGSTTDTCRFEVSSLGTGSDSFNVYRAFTPDPASASYVSTITKGQSVSSAVFEDVNMQRDGKKIYYYFSSLNDYGETPPGKRSEASCIPNFETAGTTATEPCE